MNKEGERNKGRTATGEEEGMKKVCGGQDQMDPARAKSGHGPLSRGTLHTLVMGPAWAWYSLNSFCRGSGYFIARMVPTEVPTNIIRPECEMTMAV